MEEWRSVKGFLDYQVSNLGRVKKRSYWKIGKNGRIIKIKEHICKVNNRKGWYLALILNDGLGKHKTCRIHRLVWESFRGDVPNGFVVHHKDNNKQNNNIKNLQLVSTMEHHKIHLAEHPEMIESMKRYNKLIRPKKICQYSLDGHYIAKYNNAKEASNETGVCSRKILQVCNRTEYKKGKFRTQAGGFIWRFEE